MKIKLIAGASILLCVALLAVWALPHDIPIWEQAQAQQPSALDRTVDYPTAVRDLASRPDFFTVPLDTPNAGRTTRTSPVYQAPNQEAQVLGQVKSGQLVTISSHDGRWYEIVYLDGPGGHGWISQADLSFDVAWLAPEPEITAVSLSKEEPPAEVEIASQSNENLETPTPQAAPVSTMPMGTGKPAETGDPVVEEASRLEGTLVFQASSGGAIYLLDLDSNELRYLADGLDPALSPDGSQVAFTRWDSPRGLYVIDVDGGQQRQLVGENLIKNPTWSPDGQRLIYSRQQGGSEAKTFIVPRFGEISTPEDPHWRLEVIDVDGSNLEGVPDQPHSFNPSWSEQGVLYAENGTIYVTEPGGETWASYSGSNYAFHGDQGSRA